MNIDDKEFYEWARTHPADVSAIGVIALLDELERLQSENRWIPVSERLPDVKGEYLCYLKPDMFTCFFGDSWDGNLAFRSVIQPTHWRPLPLSPSEDK